MMSKYGHLPLPNKFTLDIDFTDGATVPYDVPVVEILL